MGFTGHINDATGLTYMQARFYDPVTARFLYMDPVTFMDMGDPIYYNRFAYVGNDPIAHIDPNGEWLQVAIATGVGAVVGGGLNAYAQYKAIQSGQQTGFNAAEFGVASAAGALTGAAVSVGINPALAAGVINGAASVTTDAVNGDITDVDSAARSAVKGGVVGAISAVTGPIGAKTGGAVGGAVFQKTLDSGKGFGNALLKGTLAAEGAGAATGGALTLAGTTTTAGPLNTVLDDLSGTAVGLGANMANGLQDATNALKNSSPVPNIDEERR